MVPLICIVDLSADHDRCALCAAAEKKIVDEYDQPTSF